MYLLLIFFVIIWRPSFLLYKFSYLDTSYKRSQILESDFSHCSVHKVIQYFYVLVSVYQMNTNLLHIRDIYMYVCMYIHMLYSGNSIFGFHQLRLKITSTVTWRESLGTFLRHRDCNPNQHVFNMPIAMLDGSLIGKIIWPLFTGDKMLKGRPRRHFWAEDIAQ